MLPNSAPILSGRDIYKGSMAAHRDPKKQKQCCLIGHACKMVHGDAFGPYGPDYDIVRSQLIFVINEEMNQACFSLVTFNDSSMRSKRQVARVWNRAMYLLGYTEGNPESEPISI
jgi:hypothetical protein